MTDAPRRPSPLRLQAVDVLRRARKLPVGPTRNDLRQLAIGLRWLAERDGEPGPLNIGGAAQAPENGGEREL